MSPYRVHFDYGEPPQDAGHVALQMAGLALRLR
jgi:hypothetical protein